VIHRESQLYKNKEWMYQQFITLNKSYGMVYRETNYSRKTLEKYIKLFNINKTYEPESDRLNRLFGNEIEKLYIENNMYLNEIAKIYNSSSNIIGRILDKRNIKHKTQKKLKHKRDNSHDYRIYKVNDNYFKKINEKSAYILGFIFADGSINIKNQCLKITLNIKDKELLKTIKKEMEYTGNIYTYKNKSSKNSNKYYDNVELRITSKEILKDLLNFNISNNKSKIITFPKNTILNRYKIDFIRGYFDGDGCVDVNKKTKQIRTRICSGSKIFIEELEKTLRNYDLKPKKIYNRINIHELTYSTIESYKIYDLMYNRENCLYLKRKKIKYENGFKLRNDNKGDCNGRNSRFNEFRY
jgi:hypothetical protein